MKIVSCAFVVKKLFHNRSLSSVATVLARFVKIVIFKYKQHDVRLYPKCTTVEDIIRNSRGRRVKKIDGNPGKMPEKIVRNYVNEL